MTSISRIALRVVAVLTVLAAAVTNASAQAGDLLWGPAVNVSESGAVVGPLLTRDAAGNLYVVWWDRYEGVMTAAYQRGRWAAPIAHPIRVPRLQAGQQVVNPVTGAAVVDTLQTRPVLLPSGDGAVRAFWQGTADPFSGLQPLLSSRIPLGGGAASTPASAAGSAPAWRVALSSDGVLHLLLFDPVRSEASPPGVFYKRSTDGGARWSTAVLVADAPYVRLVSQEHARLAVTADAEGHVYAAWNDPRGGGLTLVTSADAGATWADPIRVADGPVEALRLVSAAAGHALLLWQGTGAGATILQRCTLDGGATWSATERVFDDAQRALADLDLQPMGDGRVLMIGGAGGGPPLLAMWEAAQALPGASGWSDVRATTSTGSPAREPTVRAWQVLVDEATVTAIGVGADGDAWARRAYLPADGWTFPDPAPAPSSTRPVTGAIGAWATPTALATSGATAGPAVVSAPGGRFRALWWDGAQGLVTALYDGVAWQGASAAPIAAAGSTPAGPAGMPVIVGDAAGRAQALWLGEPGGAGNRALISSMLALDRTAWTTPVVVASGVVTWTANADLLGRPQALYLRRSGDALEIAYVQAMDDGSAWGQAVPVFTTRAVDWAGSARSALALAGDGHGLVAAAWDAPDGLSISLALSADSGQTWSAPEPLVDPDRLPRHPVLAALPGHLALLWQPGDVMAVPGWYQVTSADGGRTWDAASRVSAEADAELPVRVLPLSTGGSLLLSGEGTDRLVARLWQGPAAGATGWSAPRTLDTAILDPQSGRVVALGEVRVAAGDGALLAAGRTAEGEVWALQRDITGLAAMLAPGEPWSEPQRVSSEGQWRGEAALAADSAGGLHALWAAASATGGNAALVYARYDGTRWLRPAAVLRSPQGSAEQPSLVVAGDRLHAVWAAVGEARVYHSTAFVRDAQASGSWAEPLVLPRASAAQIVADPRIAADAMGDLHVAYAVPLNEGRGIYYTRSEDGGASWKPVSVVFDAAAADWGMVGQTALAADTDGTVYVAWIRLPVAGAGSPLGVYFAYSLDEGRTWTPPAAVSVGASALPALALSQPGVVHVLWREAASGAWGHRRSTDGGITWEDARQVPGLRGSVGRAGLASDWNGALYVTGLTARNGLSANKATTLVQAVWRDAEGQWTLDEGRALGAAIAGEQGVAAALAPLQGRLAALLAAQAQADGGADASAAANGWLFSSRAVPTVSALPAPARVRVPTPTPAPTMVPTPTPRPTVNPAAPTPAPLGGALDLGLIRIPWMTIGGIVVLLLLLTATLVVRAGRRAS